MIRKLKFGESFKYYPAYSEEIINFEKIKTEKVFINPENFLHNDVGPAWECDKLFISWFWNGILIK